MTDGALADKHGAKKQREKQHINHEEENCVIVQNAF